MYIGQSKYSIKRRWLLHKWQLKNNIHPNQHLQKSWNKYGENNFEFIILEIIEDINELDEKEIYYIQKFNSYNDGYNSSLGGLNGCGWTLSEETKTKIGAKNRINMTGKKHTEETKQKMSESHKGYIKTEEHRKHLSESLTGIKRSEETKEKCRKANQGENQPTSKYKESVIKEIKLKLKNGSKVSDLSIEYNIPIGTLYSIKYEQRWKHVVV